MPLCVLLKMPNIIHNIGTIQQHHQEKKKTKKELFSENNITFSVVYRYINYIGIHRMRENRRKKTYLKWLQKKKRKAFHLFESPIKPIQKKHNTTQEFNTLFHDLARCTHKTSPFCCILCVYRNHI